MNIFFTDTSPRDSAESLPDKHIVKMPLETMQMLVSAMQRHGVDHNILTKSGTVHKGGYKNHPCTRWAGDTRENFMWLLRHGLSLCHEYTVRYGKRHACEVQLQQVIRYAEAIPEGELTPPAQAMPDELKDDDPVVAYRRYINYKVQQKPGVFTWSRAKHIPDWLDIYPIIP